MSFTLFIVITKNSQTENSKNFNPKFNIQQIFEMPYNPKSQGTVESFNKNIQRF